MYKYSDIRKVHLEITSKCNASCPQCSRNFFGKPFDSLPLTELTLDYIKKVFPEDFVRQLKVMFMSGTYGDAMVARDTVEVFEYFRACKPSMRLGMHTNGSGRKPEWWERLAAVVDYCAFGIDGLADTNHLYRRGTKWDKVVESAKAFIGAGGHADWHFIVFRHNEHQVEEARELARELGFREFCVKRTGRFLKAWKETPFSPVLGRQGQLEYLLEMPTSPQYRNKNFMEVYGDRDTAESHLAATEINCKVAGSRSVYVSAEGLVLPCCWMATLYPVGEEIEADEKQRLVNLLPLAKAKPMGRLRSQGLQEIWRLIEQLPHGKNSINATLVPLKDIVEGAFFQELVPGGWEPQSFEEGRLRVCAKHCGVCNVKASQNVKLALQSQA
ncbi:MAG: radical SAM protein [Acidobacteriota bacterium]|nr:radical SAM protein [Acidobacteriota bacterium]